MKRLHVILIVSLFLPYFTSFITSSNIVESNLLTIDKLIRGATIYIAFVALLVHLRRTRQKIFDSDMVKSILPGVVIIFLMLVHHLYSDYVTHDPYGFNARKEIVRVAILLLVFFVSNLLSNNSFDLRFLIKLMAVFGAIVALLAIWHSIWGESERSTRYVGEYLRSGTNITDSNMLGAILNLTSMFSIAGIMLSSAITPKLLYFVSVVLAQAGRILTFSTGSWINCIAMLLAAVVIFAKYRIIKVNKLVVLIIGVSALFVFLLQEMGILQTALYRATLSDDDVYKSSVVSRMEQHVYYAKYIYENPGALVFGIGPGEFSRHSTGNKQLHNSFLRQLAISGIFAFLSFLFLWRKCIYDFKSVLNSNRHDVRIFSALILASAFGWALQSLTLPFDTSILQWYYFILGSVMRRSFANSS